MPSIVNVNVTQTVAPAPNTLQQTGAFISQGGTNTAPGTLTLLTQASELTAALTSGVAISALSWSGGTVTVTTSSPHGFPASSTLPAIISGCAPAAYNGTFNITITTTTAFTYPLASDPGSATTEGTVYPYSYQELQDMTQTYFAQGNLRAVYILELGKGDAADGVSALQTYINDNVSTRPPSAGGGRIYAYLVPRAWSSESTFPSMLADYEATTAQVYFFVTMTTGNYTSFSNLLKDVIGLIESPDKPADEFTAAAPFHVWLGYQPSTINKVTPFAFAFLTGVTAYPTKGNQALLTTLKNANVNVVGTGAEGGISNTILLWGTTMDGHDATYWYSVDWVQINIDLDLANEIINGSNNPQNPLYYDQNGINRLQARAQATMNRGVTFGLVLPPANVSAVPFAQYVTENPSDYPLGVYSGLGVTYTPQRGFIQINFNVNVTGFPTV